MGEKDWAKNRGEKEEMTLVNSFTAANSFPTKILMNPKLSESIINNHIVLPWHLQLNPTNKCSFNCSFCSCANRDKNAEIDFNDLTRFIEKGCYPAATITGGGEPTFYSKINDLIQLLTDNKVESGLVTNGSNIQALDLRSLSNLTWCRISCSDELPKQTNIEKWFKGITQAVVSGPKVGWSFSYVLGDQPNFALLRQIIGFANLYNFTHVRVVSNLLNLRKVADMSIVEQMLGHYGVNCSRVIFQGRKKFTKGQKKCYISLLKPVVSAEGQLYPCCGTQYAEETPSKDYGKSMCMGGMFDLPKLIEEQKFFDGSNCQRCYYSEYNQLMDLMIAKLEHVRFV